MKPTDTYFRFPIRIFDPHSAARAKKEMDSEFGERKKIEYAVGIASVPLGEVGAWHDTYMMHREMDNVKEHGFDSTMVLTRTMGDYMCAWKRDKFESEYDAYILRMEEYLSEQERQRFPPPPPKMSLWTRFKIWLSKR